MACLQLVELDAFLVPLEGMETLRVLGAKAALDVVVHAQVALHHICEVPDNLVGIFVEQTLKLRHLLVVVEVLFIL